MAKYRINIPQLVRQTNLRLKNKTAIVTGATGGIGAATSKRYLEEGANLVMVGRSEEKLINLMK